MTAALSPRLVAIVEALPLRSGLRVLEIGCGPGALAREIARRVGPSGHMLGVDRSAAAIAQARAASYAEIEAGRLVFRETAIERFALALGEAPFDLAVAIRVGALDGRHPELESAARAGVAAALARGGRFFIDGGRPLRELALDASNLVRT